MIEILENIDHFTYSKLDHLKTFHGLGLDMKLHGRVVDPQICDLKDYQDLLAYAFLSENLRKGMKILEIGGGDSRILKQFCENFECWNLDKLEGVGNGPTELHGMGYRLVLDYIGSHNAELPNENFDIVFSISALEHVPMGDPSVYGRILTDINRVLKPGGITFHCIDHTTDVLLDEVDEAWTNPLIEYFFDNQNTLNNFVPLIEAERDPGLFFVSKEFYAEQWQPVVKKPYEEFGKPFSYNIFWRK